MKNTASGYIVAFDRSSLNLKILRHVLEKRHIKTFGTNNLFRLLNYIKELKIDALLVTLHHNDKPAKALLYELSKHRLNFPLIILKPQKMPLDPSIKAAHYITEADSAKKLLNILESYSLGSKQHQIMLLNKYSPNAESFCSLIPELNDSNCFEVHSPDAAQQYLQKNIPNVICVEYGQPFKPVPHLMNRPHIFYVDRQHDIAEIRKFLQ